MKKFLISSLVCIFFIVISVMVLIITLIFIDQFDNQQQKIVCYFPNWMLSGPFHGNGLAVQTPEDIDPMLCTHIHYAFHVISTRNNTIRDWIGPQPEIYQRFNILKEINPNLKIIVTLGGWDHDLEVKFSSLVADQERRREFINNTIDYLHTHNFDGLDIDWEFPVCWRGDCSQGPKSDRDNFAHFIQDLGTEFSKQTPKLSLSITVVGGDVAENAYDFQKLAPYLDHISVLTYDLAAACDNRTGHHSTFEWCKETLPTFVYKGIPKEKILMGIAFYGHTFKLQDKNLHHIGAPIIGQGRTPRGDGDNAFYSEVCDLVKNQGWTKETTGNGHDPIAYHDDIWVGYDDPHQAYQKSKWVRENGYGGIFVWEITQDDVFMQCCNVPYPMLRAVNYGLHGRGHHPNTYGCE